jgi:methylphosphotriester-DNA--protein-cysteine methyltransferase
LGGSDEGVEKAPSFGRAHGRATSVGNMFSSAGDELASHFTKVFRRIVGMTPSQYRADR